MQTNFNSFDSTVKAYLAKALNSLGIEYTHSQIFGVIFNGIKGIFQNAMFYIEDALTEQNIYTATRKKSVYSLARISGYEPYYGSAAVGTVLGTVVINNGLDTASTKIYIQNKTQLVNKDTGLKYSIILPTDYYIFDVAKPLVNHEFKIVEGSFSSAYYTAKGESLETFNVTIQDEFDKEYIDVYVDGEKWSSAACLYDMTEDSEEYVVTCGFDSSIEILFGNGVHGKKLIEGQNIQVNYLRHHGSLGNVSTDNTASFEFDSNCYDGFGSSVDANQYITFTNNNAVTGGNNSDSIANVRKMIGYSSRNLVYSTEDNFKLLLRRFSFIGQSSVWSEPNSLAVTISCLSNKKESVQSPEQYFELNDSDLLLTEYQKTMVTSSINNSKKIFAGLSVVFKDPIIRKYAGICYVKANSEYSKETIKTQIKNAIANYFMDLDENVQFIAKSDIVKTVIDTVDNIDSFDIHILSAADEEAYYKGYYYKYELKFINGTYEYVPVKYIYESDKHPGLDDYGNISLTSNLEIPLFHGNFKYYPNKSEYDYKTSLTIDTLQFFFI
jgi:hypothetical protein